MQPEQAEQPPGKPAFPTPGYVDCLQQCLLARGEAHPAELLMGVSGETFRFLYDQAEPERGLVTVAHNPLRAAAGALGYDSEVYSAEEPEAALDLLWERLESFPAIMRLDGDWAVVARGEEGRFAVTSADGRMRSMDRGRLGKAWAAEPGLLELGLPAWYFFQLGEKQREPDHKDSALGSIRRGIRLMTRHAKVNGCAPGLLAYEDLQRALLRPRRDARQWRLELAKFVRWQDAPLAFGAGSRRAAAAYLRLVEEHFDDDTKEHLRKAARRYDRIADGLAGLPRVDAGLVPPLDVENAAPLNPEERRAVRQFSGVRRKAARHLKKLHRIEQEAIDDLRRALDTVERKKQQ